MSERRHPAGRSAGFQPAVCPSALRLEAGGPAAWKAALRSSYGGGMFVCEHSDGATVLSHCISMNATR